jgi:hypothetical protein
MRWWQHFFGHRVTYTKVSRPMTPDEEKAFDKVFDSMDHTFKAMDELFNIARSAGGSSPPRSSTTNEGTKGSS